MDEHYIGIEIGGTKLQVVLGNGEARVLERCRVEVDKAKGATAIREKIEEIIQDILSKRKVRAVGVGFGGPVDFETGKISMSYQVAGWGDFEISRWLEELTGLAVWVDNDANTAALGEAHKGAGIGYGRVFYVTLGSGMGGGMVLDGQIYHGAKPGESEVGLMCIDKTGASVESHCCGWAVDAKIRRYISKHPDSILAKLVGDETKAEARFLLEAMEQGDAHAHAIFEETTKDLAFALSLTAHLFHPEVIILGGGLSHIGEPLRAAVASHLPRFMTQAFKPGPEVKTAALGEDAVCVGALLLAKKAVSSSLS